MKNCPRCNANMDDNAMFCHNCGLQFAQNQPEQNTYAQPNQAPVPPVPTVSNPYDHTAEFSAEEVSEGKLFAMLMYLTSIIGIIVALLAKKSNNSAYLAFHLKQAMKVFICQTLLGIGAGLLAWTCIAPFAAAVCVIIVLVLQIICFFKTAANKSIEVPIIRSIGFLN